MARKLTPTHSQEFLDWIKKAGIVPELARRVVIDIPRNGPVLIYVELYGSAELLKVEPPPELLGAKVSILNG
jgi:hypothetical protein